MAEHVEDQELLFLLVRGLSKTANFRNIEDIFARGSRMIGFIVDLSATETAEKSG